VLTIELPTGCASRVVALTPAVEARTKVIIIATSKAKALTLIDLNGLGEVANIHHKPDDQQNSFESELDDDHEKDNDHDKYDGHEDHDDHETHCNLS